MKPLTEQNYYEVLEVSPDRSPLEIRRAYKNSFELYQENSIASYSFFSEDERQEILARIEQAYLTLINPETRKAYDQSLISSGVLVDDQTFQDRTKEPIAIYNFRKYPLDSPAPACRSGELRLRIERNPVIRDLLASDTLGGADLQKVRMVLDVTLEAIAEKTNIRIDILRAIETENLDLFPPLVYLKGFLRAYIRFLELDEHVVLNAYLKKLGLQ